MLINDIIKTLKGNSKTLLLQKNIKTETYKYPQARATLRTKDKQQAAAIMYKIPANYSYDYKQLIFIISLIPNLRFRRFKYDSVHIH